MTPGTPAAFFAGHDEALAAFETVRAMVERLRPVDIRVSKSQVAFRRRRGFAFLWSPAMYLGERGAAAVLSIALDHELDSPRFKEVVHPSPRTWMHHLEIHSGADLDDEVAGWLRAAFEAA